ncbi:unnamed protein product [Spirodela intermedia]|uniref:WRKY domain-containing protein n=1 Tax=Spirodela intermedia TaxID=51605 RepID=A0A7I8LFN3_SPIIN|nr:unnamed protein product [Spirodela intermedia]
MAEEPSTEAMEQTGRQEDVGEKPPSPLPSASPPRKKRDNTSRAAAVSAATDPTAVSSPVSAKGAAAKTSALETLAIPIPVTTNSGFLSNGSHGVVDCRSFSQLLAGAMASPVGNSRSTPILALPVDAVRLPVVAVPCIIAPAALLESPGFAGQFAMTHQAVLATVTAHAQMQLQTGYTSPSVISTISPLPLQQVPPSASEHDGVSSVVEQPPSADQKLQTDRVALNTTSGDGFNWRKYGQKQVKSGENSRSYYKCTHSNCFAKKKVERCQDGHVVEIVYRGGHNHDPPQKSKSPKERGPPSSGHSGDNETLTPAISDANGSIHLASKVSSRRSSNSNPAQKTKHSKERRPQSIGSSGDNETITLASGDINGSEPSPSKLEENSGSDTSDRQLAHPSDRDGDADIKNEEGPGDEPSPKRSKTTESPLPSATPPSKTVKEQRVVVQKVSDGGIVSDGYRWRKYGQKFVKGNPNPRSYYRCTQIGCPVRKHVEKDSVDPKAFIITYEGEHNHDRPPPKHDGDPPVLLIAAAAAAAAAASGSAGGQPPASPPADEGPKVESRPDVDSKASEHGADQALESAQTLLSMGLKPAAAAAAEEAADGKGSDAMQRPLFDKNRPPVPVQNS